MRLAERIAAFLIIAMSAMPAARAAEPYHLRIGWVVAGADVATLMFNKPELAPHAGKSYVPELIHFQGTPTEMQALATGQLDIAALAYSTFALGVVNAGMQDLRVIGDVFQDGFPGYHTNAFIVRNDSPIHKVEDLKGKVLATNQSGSAVDMAVRAMLAKHHLQDKRDLTMIEVRFPDMAAMLKEGKVDFITAVNPFGFDPALRSFTRTLFTQADAIGKSQMIVHAAREGFLQEHRAAVLDFMQDYIHALRFLLDPANHAETVAILAKETKRQPEFFASWAFTNEDYYRDPAALPDLDALQKNVDLQKELGFLRKAVDVKNYADLSIAKEAAQRLAAGQ